MGWSGGLLVPEDALDDGSVRGQPGDVRGGLPLVGPDGAGRQLAPVEVAAHRPRPRSLLSAEFRPGFRTAGNVIIHRDGSRTQRPGPNAMDFSVVSVRDGVGDR